jgi:outer membrane protein assembly factor BamB
VKRWFVVLAIACGSSDVNDVPLAKAPWPKFRYDARQTGRSDVKPSLTGGASWSFKTQKGIFSSPVVAADGTVYVGSADRNFFAIHPDGTLAWQVATGEIIDSSALLDDRGHVYFGSGDGKLRALDAATGNVLWTMQADDPSANDAFINWFEGNVAIGPQGTLYVPNDNFFVYGVDRDTGAATMKYRMPDQTWSLPAIDAKSGTFYIGNNNLLPVLGKNTFSIEPDGSSTNWAVASLGTVAASPLLTDTAVIVGGFDGFMHAYSRDDGTELWSLPARDHIYSSPAQMSDGTIVQPAADGTIYAVTPDGKLRWTFDAGTPFRSSPAIDGQDDVYVGGGDGFLYVVNKDGTLRWRMKLIDDVRNDLNSSPALGASSVYIGGESGEIFSVPYDFCLRPASQNDPRCAPMATPADGASLVWTNLFGDPGSPNDAIAANGRITLSLSVRNGGASQLAILDSTQIQVTTTPSAAMNVDVSGDGKFMSITPQTTWPAGPLQVQVSAGYLIDLDRTGLRLSGGHPGGTAQATFQTSVQAPSGGAIDPTSAYEVYRLSVPLPTIMPSYNQIGFDSLHYLFGVVELTGNQGVAWMIGGMLPDGQSTSVPDPSTKAIFPLAIAVASDAVTMNATSGVRIQVSNFALPFASFRVATTFTTGGDTTGAELAGSAKCGDIDFYGPYLQQLGLCNPQTDVIRFLAASNTRRRADLVAPTGIGTVAYAMNATSITATLTGSSVKLADHVVSLLAIDAATGAPVPLDYAFSTSATTNADGTLATVSVATKGATIPSSMRVHLMIDTFSADQGTIP